MLAYVNISFIKIFELKTVPCLKYLVLCLIEWDLEFQMTLNSFQQSLVLFFCCRDIFCCNQRSITSGNMTNP